MIGEWGSALATYTTPDYLSFALTFAAGIALAYWRRIH